MNGRRVYDTEGLTTFGLTWAVTARGQTRRPIDAYRFDGIMSGTPYGRLGNAVNYSYRFRTPWPSDRFRTRNE